MIPPRWQLIGSKFCITPPSIYTLLVTPPPPEKNLPIPARWDKVPGPFLIFNE